MSVKVEVVLDSINTSGVRLTTFRLTYPRIIHAELMTHRLFSRNTSSSRAIPVVRQILNTVRHMAAPVEWGSNKPGMQAGEELTGWRRWAAEALWYGCGYMVAGFSFALAKVGAHKQIANRPLEPWTHVTVILTATDFANWFALRKHSDADPTIRLLAHEMYWAMRDSKPQPLLSGEWHIPFVNEDLPLDQMLKLSAARCAVQSFNRERPVTLEDADRIWARLTSTPVHASPFEHQAYADPLNQESHLHGNLRGFVQHRKLLPEEAVYG